MEVASGPPHSETIVVGSAGDCVQIFAYEFYGTRGMPNEAEAARRDVMRDWRTLRGCMRTWQFPQQVTCLMRSLPPTD